MAGSLAAALAQIKSDVAGAISPAAVEQACAELHYDGWRAGPLDPATTIALFVQQVLAGNVPCSEVRHLAGQSFTASAWCQARARLPLQVYQAMLTRLCEAALPQTREARHRWRGHRTFHVDGSTFSMPDTPALRRAFGTPGGGQAAGCGFPVAHLLVLFNAATGLLLDAFASPLRTGDVAQAAEYLAHLDAGDVLIGDDSFSGYAHVALIARANLHAIVPNHHLRIVDFRPGRTHSVVRGKTVVAGLPRSRWVASLGQDDQLVEWFKPAACPGWMAPAEYDALPASVVVREIRRTLRRPGGGGGGGGGRRVTVTIVTTLLDPLQYPADEVVELRLRRWDVETNIRHLKQTMGMDVLRCKSEAGVRKELAVFCLVYNLVRVVMLEAARRQHAPVSRVSFADALKWTRHARPGEPLRELLVNPLRPGRLEPRCRKRRPKEYDLMNKPRDALRKTLKNQNKSV
jgi:hypothetical protein